MAEQLGQGAEAFAQLLLLLGNQQLVVVELLFEAGGAALFARALGLRVFEHLLLLALGRREAPLAGAGFALLGDRALFDELQKLVHVLGRHLARVRRRGSGGRFVLGLGRAGQRRAPDDNSAVQREDGKQFATGRH